MCLFDEIDAALQKEHLARLASHRVWIEDLERALRQETSAVEGMEGGALAGFHALFGIRRRRSSARARRLFSSAASGWGLLGRWLMESKEGGGSRAHLEGAAKRQCSCAQLALGKELWSSGRKRDLPRSKRLWLAAAKNGCAEAQYELGLMKSIGFVFRQDWPGAIPWTRLAAEQGHWLGMATHGRNLLFGNHTKSDLKQAEKYLLRAAEVDDPYALNDLGILYHFRSERAADKKKAAFYFERGAKLGHESAQTNFASMLLRGNPGPKEKRRALRLYRRAAAKGSSLAASRLAENYLMGRWTRKKMRLAVLWTQRAASLGDPLSSYNYGIMLLDGDGVPRDIRAAMRWFHKATEVDEEEDDGADEIALDAWEALAYLYEGDEGVRRNPKKLAECRRAIRRLKRKMPTLSS